MEEMRRTSKEPRWHSSTCEALHKK